MPNIQPATAPAEILFAGASIDIQAAAGDPTKPARVSILAYSGGIMRVPKFGDVVIDLAGLTAAPQVQLLADHQNDLEHLLGNGRPMIRGQRLHVDGHLSRASEAARRIIAMSQEGIPLEASVGVRPQQTERLRAGQVVHVNGRAITAPGPLTLIRKSSLYEISIVAIGADRESSVSIAARSPKGLVMDYETWLAAKGFDPATVTATQQATLRASFDAELGTGPPPLPGTPTAVQTLRDDAAGENDRIAAIHRACNGQHHDLQARAIREGWDENRARLEVLRASRPTGPAIHAHQTANSADIVTCALMLHAGMDSMAENDFDDRTMEAASHAGLHSLVDVCKASLQLEGIVIPSGRNQMIKAAFSTVSLPTILSNVAGKSMLNAYTAFPSAARVIARKLTANDFKTQTGVRLTGDFKMEEVGADGSLKHALVGEDSYTFKIATYGRIIQITRQTIINDDLGALDEIPRVLGRGAAVAVDEVFWTLVLANTGTFFGSDNSNYQEGAETTLDNTGLGSAVTLALQQVDQDGHPISVVPKWLVVPPELKVAADELYASKTFNATGSTDDKVPAANAFHNLYRPLTAPHLSNSSYTGNSALAWYLFGDPADVASFGLAYLQGQEYPTIEQVDVGADVLGIAYRGYLDFGVCQVDSRGGIKSKGEA